MRGIGGGEIPAGPAGHPLGGSSDWERRARCRAETAPDGLNTAVGSGGARGDLITDISQPWRCGDDDVRGEL